MKTNGTEPPYVGCYGFLNRPWINAVVRAILPVCREARRGITHQSWKAPTLFGADWDHEPLA